MYYAEDYVEFVRDTEALVKEIEKLDTDNEELYKIISILGKLAKHTSCLAESVALSRGVDISDY